jgi:hypothetical protein
MGIPSPIGDASRPFKGGWTIPINNGGGEPFDNGGNVLKEVVVAVL